MNQNLSSFNNYLNLSFSPGVNKVKILCDMFELFTFVPKSYHVTIHDYYRLSATLQNYLVRHLRKVCISHYFVSTLSNRHTKEYTVTFKKCSNGKKKQLYNEVNFSSLYI